MESKINVIEENAQYTLYVKPLDAVLRDFISIVELANPWGDIQLVYDATKAALIAEALVQAAQLPGINIAAFVGENYVVTVKNVNGKVIINERIDGQEKALPLTVAGALALADALDNFAANWDKVYA